MKKILALALVFIVAFQAVAFAECAATVTEKSTSGAKVSISGAEVSSAKGVWVDFDADGSMLKCTPADVTFTDGAGEAVYTGSFTNLKFMLWADMTNIKPLCDSVDIVLDNVIFDQDEGIEDLGDVE